MKNNPPPSLFEPRALCTLLVYKRQKLDVEPLRILYRVLERDPRYYKYKLITE